jgi:hypothetical protein
VEENGRVAETVVGVRVLALCARRRENMVVVAMVSEVLVRESDRSSVWGANVDDDMFAERSTRSESQCHSGG